MSVYNLLLNRSPEPVDAEETYFWNWLSNTSSITTGEANEEVFIHAINYKSVTSGPGERTELFFQGCNHNCPGCFSPQTHQFHIGQRMTVLDVLLILRPSFGTFNRAFSPRISFCGGEPFAQTRALYLIAKYLKEYASFCGRNIHLLSYTGYNSIEDLKEYQYCQEILELLDVIVVGKFIYEDRFDLNKDNRNFIGSSNQKYIILDDDGDSLVELSAEKANDEVNMDPYALVNKEDELRECIKKLEDIFYYFSCN